MTLAASKMTINNLPLTLFYFLTEMVAWRILLLVHVTVAISCYRNFYYLVNQ